MKSKKTYPYYIYHILIFCVFCSNTIFSQTIQLHIYSIDSTENAFLKKIPFQKKYEDSLSVKSNITALHNNLKEKGFFFNSYKKEKSTDFIYSYKFNLGKKVNKIQVDLDKTQKILPVEKLSFFLDSVSKNLSNKGYSFSEVSLKNIRLKKDILFATLKITKTKIRTTDRVLVKGYENFPKNYVKHFLKITNKSIFSKQELNRISAASNNLPFVTEIKKPEVLFSKDSTIIYLYLKKKKISNFEGLINFSTNQNNDLLFNGNLNLELHNTLNTGESFSLNWKANGEERQSIDINTSIPYIFNSPVSGKIGLKIHKQDSTFSNTNFVAELNYNLSSKSTVGLLYTTEDSNVLLTNNTENIKTYSKWQIGSSFNFKTYLQNFDYNTKKTSMSLELSFGKRIEENSSSNQFKATSDFSRVFQINRRNHVYLRNASGILTSKKLYTNELFRLGGENSIRGYLEESLFTSKYSYLNTEYRFLIGAQSYLYSILDIGYLENNTLNSFGLGLRLHKNKSIINLSIAKPFNVSLRESQLSVKIVNYF